MKKWTPYDILWNESENYSIQFMASTGGVKMASEVEFQLNRPTAVFHSGEFLHGRIVLKTLSTKRVRAVSIIFLGAADVRWTETRGTNLAYRTGYKEFVHSITKVRDTGELPLGTHTYTFQLLIPPNCVTSCNDAHGEVRYKLQLELAVLKGKDELFELSIMVIQPVDLNLVPANQLPVRLEQTKSLCCWPCRGGSIDMQLSLPYAGFVSGQELSYTLEIHNRSDSLRLKKYSMKLLQRYTYESDAGWTTYSVNELWQHEEVVEIGRDFVQCFRGELRIPPVPPTTPAEIVSLMRVAYILRLELALGAWHRNQLMEVPISIGTVPVSGAEVDTRTAMEGFDGNIAGSASEEIRYYTQNAADFQLIYHNFDKPSDRTVY